jgi:hypothetical protein
VRELDHQAPCRAVPPIIDANAVFTLETARTALDLKRNCLPREIRKGRLRATKRAGRYFILGSWVLEWLEQGEVRRQRQPTDSPI